MAEAGHRPAVRHGTVTTLPLHTLRPCTHYLTAQPQCETGRQQQDMASYTKRKEGTGGSRTATGPLSGESGAGCERVCGWASACMDAMIDRDTRTVGHPFKRSKRLELALERC